jgi:hypothetical protein
MRISIQDTSPTLGQAPRGNDKAIKRILFKSGREQGSLVESPCKGIVTVFNFERAESLVR